MANWTADADHFTVDDNTNHTADGWHTDVVVITPAPASRTFNAGGIADFETRQRGRNYTTTSGRRFTA